jgi:hypothetical protein
MLIVVSKNEEKTENPGSADAVDKTSDVASVDLANRADGKTKKKRLTTSDGADVQIGDIDSTETLQGSAKSRRKQVAPRKVAEECGDKIAADEDGSQLSVAADGTPVTASKSTVEIAGVVQDIENC